MICPACHFQNQATATFCVKCGSALTVTENEPPQPIPIVASTPSPLPVVAAAQPTAPNLAASAPNPPGKKSGSRKWWLLGCAGVFFLGVPLVTSAILLAMGILPLGSSDPADQAAQTTAVTAASATAGKEATQPAAAASAEFFDQTALNNLVASVPGASVAATFGDQVYDSPLANEQKPNAGFYVPVWIAAHKFGNSAAVSNADAMLSQMNNEAGNQAIEEMGNLGAVNNWLSSQGWTMTSFNRKFGDTEAAAWGRENYTSAHDAAGIMQAGLADNLQAFLRYPIQQEGIVPPAGTTIAGLRGQGIADMWSFYIVMSKGDKTVCVAVLTQNQGKNPAVNLTNQVLQNLAAKM